MLKNFFILILISTFSISAMAQNIDFRENKIIVFGTSKIDLPADKVTFSINLTYSDPTDVKKAFAKHKTAEEKLLGFLKEAKVQSKDIQYTLITIGKQYIYDQVTQKNKVEFNTLQNVSICIYDLKQYADFMMKLINAGYQEVSASFGSTKDENFHENLYSLAIDNAKQKATALAKSSDVKLKGITTITEENDAVAPQPMYADAKVMSAANNGGMIEVPQTISKFYSLKVVFRIQ